MDSFQFGAIYLFWKACAIILQNNSPLQRKSPSKNHKAAQPLYAIFQITKGKEWEWRKIVDWSCYAMASS